MESEGRVPERKEMAGYGDTRPFQAEWAEQSAALRAAEQVCRHCKAARTRAKNKGKVDWQAATCGPCRNRSRVAFATSPASENYWCS